MRCFVAIPLPAEVRAKVAAVEAEARRACADADVRWTAPASLHLTLKFLGNVGTERLDTIRPVLARAVDGVRLPVLSLGGLGAFPQPRRARVLWLGVTDGAAALADLAAAVDERLAALGFEPEPRPFTAHLTLGRVRAPRGGADLRSAFAACGNATVGSWRPEAVVLYESSLRPGGAVHEARAVWPLP
jgi:2'-5' RNA ligase